MRIYGYSGVGSPAASTANWRIDDLALGVIAESTAVGAPAITTQPVATGTTYGGSAVFTVVASGTPTPTYQWRKDGTAISGATNATLALSGVALSAAGSYDVVVTNSAGSVTSTAATLTVNKATATVTLAGLAATFDGSPKSATATTTPAGLTVTFTYAGSSTAPSAIGSYAVVGTISDANYTGSASGTLVISATATNSAPTITAQPSDAIGRIGAGITFSVVATGTPAPTYQWRKNGAAITGATNSTYAIASAAPADAGSYDVVVTNSLGSATSAIARLTVTTVDVAPVITSQPRSLTVARGLTATFAVRAAGGPALSYRWYRRSGIFAAEIPGATSATYAIVNAETSSAGDYFVHVSNSTGVAESVVVTLRVITQSLAGDYFGTIGGLGSFALHVRDDNTAVFLGFLSGSKTPCIARELTIDDAGRFTFTVETNLNFTCTIGTDGALTGTLSGSAITTLAATRSAAGATSPLAGIYQASVAGSSSTAFAIVSPAGQVFVLAQTATGADAGTGTIDSSGRIAITTAGNQTVAGTLAVDSSLSLTITAAGGQPTTLTGASDVVVAAQRFVNVSTRAISDTGSGTTIAGFIINGQDSKPILLRAIGPGLAAYGVSGVLAKPLLQLYSGSTLVGSNAGWSTNTNADEIAAAAVRVGGFPLATTSADSAMFVTLAPGSYTGVITGADGGTGVVLVEAYDVSTPSPGQKMINISTRTQVGSGDNVCIAGFVVSGSGPKRLLIRGVGPGLTQFGLAGALAKPQLTLYRGSTVIAQNAGWAASADAAQITAAAVKVGAFAFTSNDEAALLLSLEPGGYTAVLSGVNNTTGVGLVEVYEVP